MSLRRRHDAAYAALIAAVWKRAPEEEDVLPRDDVLDLLRDYRDRVAVGPIRRWGTRLPFSRPCYDKPHRCPGRAGGGMKYALVSRCEKGMLPGGYRRRWWLGARCPDCGLLVLPLAVQWLDPGWLKYVVTTPHQWPPFIRRWFDS